MSAYKPNVNYEFLTKCTERLEDLLNEYKKKDVCYRTLYEILEPLFIKIYQKQLKEEIGDRLLDGILGCAGYQISDSGLDLYCPDLGPLYSDFYWEVQGLGTHPDRKPGIFYRNSIKVRDEMFGA